jgi:hypothetical protein
MAAKKSLLSKIRRHRVDRPPIAPNKLIAAMSKKQNWDLGSTCCFHYSKVGGSGYICDRVVSDLAQSREVRYRSGRFKNYRMMPHADCCSELGRQLAFIITVISLVAYREGVDLTSRVLAAECSYHA